MQDGKQKDNLTDLVNVVASEDVSGNGNNDGEMTTPSGDKVTLGLFVVVQRLLRRVKNRKKAERTVRVRQ